MDEITVIDDPRTAEVSLNPVRSRMLAELVDGDSAASLAAKLGLPRQKVNYHLRALEEHGLVELVEERRKRNMTERVMRATAASYVISPAALSSVAPDPDRAPDRLSAQWLLALAGRLVQELGVLLHRSQEAGQSLPSFGMDTEIVFATAGDRAAFVAQLTESVESLVATYHAGAEPGGRKHRLIVALHPSITKGVDGPGTDSATPEPRSHPDIEEA
jgi:DNA-binding transcriptional ArsR family regulator